MVQRVLITGGAGFIGCNLARHLQRADYEVFALDDLSLGKRENLPPSVLLTEGDLVDSAVWDRVPAADAVVHLAGASSAPMFKEDLAGCFRNNIEGFIQVLNYAERHGCRKVVFASTSSVYGNVPPPLREEGPLDIPNYYAASKYSMEQIARVHSALHGIDVVGLRFMSVYGPREDHKGRFANLVSQFIWDIEAGRAPVVYGDGTQTRDFTNVGDIAQAIRRVLEHAAPLGSEVFNVGVGTSITVNALVAMLSELMAVPVTPQWIPNPVGVGYVQNQLASLDKVRSVLGYQPEISLEEGIREVLAARRAARR